MPNSRFELVFYYSSKLELSATVMLSHFHVRRHHGACPEARTLEVGLYESPRPRQQLYTGLGDKRWNLSAVQLRWVTAASFI